MQTGIFRLSEPGVALLITLNVPVLKDAAVRLRRLKSKAMARGRPA